MVLVSLCPAILSVEYAISGAATVHTTTTAGTPGDRDTTPDLTGARLTIRRYWTWFTGFGTVAWENFESSALLTIMVMLLTMGILAIARAARRQGTIGFQPATAEVVTPLPEAINQRRELADRWPLAQARAQGFDPGNQTGVDDITNPIAYVNDEFLQTVDGVLAADRLVESIEFIIAMADNTDASIKRTAVDTFVRRTQKIRTAFLGESSYLPAMGWYLFRIIREPMDMPWMQRQILATLMRAGRNSTLGVAVPALALMLPLGALSARALGNLRLRWRRAGSTIYSWTERFRIGMTASTSVATLAVISAHADTIYQPVQRTPTVEDTNELTKRYNNVLSRFVREVWRDWRQHTQEIQFDETNVIARERSARALMSLLTSEIGIPRAHTEALDSVQPRQTVELGAALGSIEQPVQFTSISQRDMEAASQQSAAFNTRGVIGTRSSDYVDLHAVQTGRTRVGRSIMVGGIHQLRLRTADTFVDGTEPTVAQPLDIDIAEEERVYLTRNVTGGTGPMVASSVLAARVDPVAYARLEASVAVFQAGQLSARLKQVDVGIENVDEDLTPARVLTYARKVQAHASNARGMFLPVRNERRAIVSDDIEQITTIPVGFVAKGVEHPDRQFIDPSTGKVLSKMIATPAMVDATSVFAGVDDVDEPRTMFQQLLSSIGIFEAREPQASTALVVPDGDELSGILREADRTARVQAGDRGGGRAIDPLKIYAWLDAPTCEANGVPVREMAPNGQEYELRCSPRPFVDGGAHVRRTGTVVVDIGSLQATRAEGDGQRVVLTPVRAITEARRVFDLAIGDGGTFPDPAVIAEASRKLDIGIAWVPIRITPRTTLEEQIFASLAPLPHSDQVELLQVGGVMSKPSDRTRLGRARLAAKQRREQARVEQGNFDRLGVSLVALSQLQLINRFGNINTYLAQRYMRDPGAAVFTEMLTTAGRMFGTGAAVYTLVTGSQEALQVTQGVARLQTLGPLFIVLADLFTRGIPVSPAFSERLIAWYEAITVPGARAVETISGGVINVLAPTRQRIEAMRVSTELVTRQAATVGTSLDPSVLVAMLAGALMTISAASPDVVSPDLGFYDVFARASSAEWFERRTLADRAAIRSLAGRLASVVLVASHPTTRRVLGSIPGAFGGFRPARWLSDFLTPPEDIVAVGRFEDPLPLRPQSIAGIRRALTPLEIIAETTGTFLATALGLLFVDGIQEVSRLALEGGMSRVTPELVQMSLAGVLQHLTSTAPRQVTTLVRGLYALTRTPGTRARREGRNYLLDRVAYYTGLAVDADQLSRVMFGVGIAETIVGALASGVAPRRKQITLMREEDTYGSGWTRTDLDRYRERHPITGVLMDWTRNAQATRYASRFQTLARRDEEGNARAWAHMGITAPEDTGVVLLAPRDDEGVDESLVRTYRLHLMLVAVAQPSIQLRELLVMSASGDDRLRANVRAHGHYLGVLFGYNSLAQDNDSFTPDSTLVEGTFVVDTLLTDVDGQLERILAHGRLARAAVGDDAVWPTTPAFAVFYLIYALLLPVRPATARTEFGRGVFGTAPRVDPLTLRQVLYNVMPLRLGEDNVVIDITEAKLRALDSVYGLLLPNQARQVLRLLRAVTAPQRAIVAATLARASIDPVVDPNYTIIDPRLRVGEHLDYFVAIGDLGELDPLLLTVVDDRMAVDLDWTRQMTTPDFDAYARNMPIGGSDALKAMDERGIFINVREYTDSDDPTRLFLTAERGVRTQDGQLMFVGVSEQRDLHTEVAALLDDPSRTFLAAMLIQRTLSDNTGSALTHFPLRHAVEHWAERNMDAHRVVIAEELKAIAPVLTDIGTALTNAVYDTVTNLTHEELQAIVYGE